MTAPPSVIVALDVPAPEAALDWVRRLKPAFASGSLAASQTPCFKLGLQLFCLGGPDLVKAFKAEGVDVFLDLKLHDIPHQVEGACHALKDLGVKYLTIHTSGGLAMMQAAARVFEGTDTCVLGVTLLTSLDETHLDTFFPNSALNRSAVVPHWATLARQADLGGVVCSAYENQAIRQAVDNTLALVNPGIRWPGDSHDDQKKVVSPQDAARLGANAIVMGRSILGANDPLHRCTEVLEALSAVCP
ncbi:MAG: orotidine-5'-phosphate decarboxylase [Cyanobacteria bacterium HKST-UBA04]|nr:orotidine-5'-phosphate decarboxylase [Cyanobacteria bacterium HKST-UBA04]